MASDNTLLSEIARKLRKLECICANTASTGGAIVQAYQPLDCNGTQLGPLLTLWLLYLLQNKM